MARKLLKKPLKKKKKQPVYRDFSDEQELAAVSESRNKELIATQAIREFEAGLKYKKNVMESWVEIERTYNLEKEKHLATGRSDYPLPVLSGYIDTLHSKIDDPPYCEFEHLTLADKPRAKKTTAAWRFYADPEHADWEGEDRAGKKIAIITGRAIFLTYCESDPEFAHYFELIDTYDYVAQALGGGDIKKHRYGYQDNIFRSAWELQEAPHYNQGQVAKLIAAIKDKTLKRNAVLYRNKVNRLISVGLNPESFLDYAGDDMFRLTQGFTTYRGKRYWLTMEMSTGIWLRCDPLNDVFASKRHPFVSWATHYDKFNFWSKSPAMDILPVARGIRDLYNEGMHNIKKRNSGQRAYDPEIFDEPELLEWRPDGLVPASSVVGKSIGQGIYEFKTEDNTTIIANMMTFSDNLVGTKTGITAGAQGQSDKDVKVGVYYGDLQQVADRLGLTNKYYVQMWRDAAYLFSWGIWEHFPAKLMVKVVGEEGVGWEELKQEDVEPDFSVVVKSGRAELEANAFKQKRKDDSLAAIIQDPRYAAYLNPIISIQMRLRSAGWDEEDIRTLMDVQTLGDEPSLIRASQAIQDLLEGKEPRLYQKAALPFLKKIKDYLDENDLKPDVEARFIAYFSKMMPIVAKNMARRAALGGPALVAPGMGPVPQNPQVPLPNTAEGTLSQSELATNANSPANPATA